MVQKHFPMCALLDGFQNRLRMRRAGSCSVYGSASQAAAFLKDLGKDGVHGNREQPYKTRFHVVFMGGGGDMLNFYREHLQQITAERIALEVESTEDFIAPRENVHAFSLREIIAALFWGSFPAKPDEKIAFIGAGSLIEALLKHGLCLNLYSTVQCIQYHIWSADLSPGQITGIEQMTMDKIIFHTGSLEESQTQLAQMGRIILCDESQKNESVLEQLIILPECPPIFFYANSISKGQKVEIPAHITVFGTWQEILRREIILEEALLCEAKALNKHCGGEPWGQTDPFKRKDMTSSASYFPVLRRLFKAGIPLETLFELEHIRWSRFYFLHGWKYAPETDCEKRLHNHLISYSEIPPEAMQRVKDYVVLATWQSS